MRMTFSIRLVELKLYPSLDLDENCQHGSQVSSPLSLGHLAHLWSIHLLLQAPSGGPGISFEGCRPKQVIEFWEQ